MAPTNPEPQPAIQRTPAETFARAVHELGRWTLHLHTALRMDGFDAGDRERLTANDFARMARQAAHYGLIVLAAMTRHCGRCGDLLISTEDKRQAACEPCRFNRTALRVMRGGRA